MLCLDGGRGQRQRLTSQGRRRLRRGPGEPEEAGQHPLLHQRLEVWRLLRLRLAHEVRDQPLADCEIHPGEADQELGGLRGAVTVALSEPRNVLHRVPRLTQAQAAESKAAGGGGQFLDVPHGQLEDVRLLQFADIVHLSLEAARHDLLSNDNVNI